MLGIMSHGPRVQQACMQCRDRKRKCDGNVPACELCTRHGLSCTYQKSTRTRGRPVRGTTAHTDATREARATDSARGGSSSSAATPGDSSERNNSREHTAANSGCALPYLLATRFDSGPQHEVKHMGWNVGLGDLQVPGHAQKARHILSEEDATRLCGVYFDVVYPYYRSFGRAEFEQRMGASWRENSNDSNLEASFEGVLCGVMALGSLFSGGCSQEEQLLKSARSFVDHQLDHGQQSLDLIDALILRTLYLRLTVGPQSSWLSSCSLVLMIETMRTAHLRLQQSPATAKETSVGDGGPYLDRYRVARLLNTWISFECGRNRIHVSDGDQLRLMTKLPIQTPSSDPQVQLMTMLELSEDLDPHTAHTVNFEDLLASVCRISTKDDVIALSRCNLAIAFFRRLRLQRSGISPDALKYLIEAGLVGIDAAQRLAEQGRPWHHVANVPFQYLCLLLVIDTRESLARTGHALAVVDAVAHLFPTPSMTELATKAAFLVELVRQRKAEDLSILSIMGQYGSAGPLHRTTSLPMQIGNSPVLGLDLDDIDWNTYLSNDMAWY